MAANDHIGVLPSATHTADVTGDAITNLDRAGLHLIIDVTVLTAGASIVPKIQAHDTTSDKWYDLLVGAALTATGTSVLKIFPGASPVANAVANDHLPRYWRVFMDAADAKSVTYSIGAELFA